MSSSSSQENSARVATERAGRRNRRTPRRVFSRPIGVLHQGEYEVVQASQLSEGGIGFISSKQLAHDALVVISLVMPGGGVVVGRGQIVQSRSQGDAFNYGVKFIAMSLPLRRMIRNYVTAKTQAEAEMEAEDERSKGAVAD